jgi:hypothetical protein
MQGLSGAECLAWFSNQRTKFAAKVFFLCRDFKLEITLAATYFFSVVLS